MMCTLPLTQEERCDVQHTVHGPKTKVKCNSHMISQNNLLTQNQLINTHIQQHIQQQHTTNKIQLPNTLASSIVELDPSSSTSFTHAAPTISLSASILPTPTPNISSPLPSSLLPSLLPPSVGSPSSLPFWLSTLDSMESSHYLPPSDLAVIRSYITHGISFNFINDQPPPPLHINNSHSVRQHTQEVRERLADYVAIGAVKQLPPSTTPPSHVQPLHVVVKPGKKPRVCIDLSRNMNDFIPHHPFHYENIDTAVSQSWPGCWYTKLDLSNCFLSFPLHPSMYQYFTFSFDGVYWCFTSMPFGLGEAPHACTLLLSVPAFALAQQNIRATRYLDDFLHISHTQQLAQQHLNMACKIFAQFGLVVNPEKTTLPTQCIIFLGILLDSITCTLACTQERIDELLALAQSFLSPPTTHTTKTRLQSLLGKLSFASQVLVGARPFLRSIIDHLHSPSSSSSAHHLPLTSSFHADLLYWSRFLATWNGHARWHDEPHPLIISTDASGDGFGIYIEQLPVDCSSPHLLHTGIAGLWSQQTQVQHHDIGTLEFFAILYAAHLYAPLLTDRTLIVYCDNLPDVHIINRQSTRSKATLLHLRALYSLTASINCRVRAIHRPGVDNIVADYLSRPDKHQFSFTHTHTMHCSSLPLSCVTVLDSSLLQLIPLRSALANHSLMLSHFSPPSLCVRTLRSPMRVISAASSNSANSSNTRPCNP